MSYKQANPLDQRRYVLQDKDGSYVESVTSTGMETVKLHFKFTDNIDNAKIFSFDDLWWRLATTCVGIHFTQGFAGGKAVRVR